MIFYETSKAQSATCEPLLAVGDYTDVQSIIDGAVTRNVGVYVLDGTENWNKSGTYTGSFYADLAIGKLNNYTQILCSHGFATSDLTEYASASIGAVCCINTRFNYKYDDGTATVAQFKQWLAAQSAAGTPVIVVYPLAEPTTESVTGQTLQVQGGDNTLEITQASLNNLELEAKYMKEE